MKLIDNNYLIAKGLFESLQLSFGINNSVDSNIQTEINRVLNEAKSRQEILDKVIEFIGDANTIEKRYLLAKALSWSRVSKRSDAIIALNNTIQDKVNISDFSKTSHFVFYPYIEDKNLIEMNIYKSDLYFELSKKYAGEHQFEEALDAAIMAYNLTPFYAHSIINVCNCFVYLNELENAKLFYEEVMNSEYFNLKIKSLNNDQKQYLLNFKEIVSRYYDELLVKIKKGYIYKPRLKKDNR